MKFKRLGTYTILLFLCVLTAAGCSNRSITGSENGKEQNTGKGRYVEETAAFPKDLKSVFSMKKMEDGSLFLAAETFEETLVVYTSKDDGDTWIISDSVNSSLIPEGKRIVAATIDSKGKLYIAYADPMEKDHLNTITAFTGTIAYCRIDSKGKAQDIQLKLPEFKSEDAFATGLYYLAVNMKGDLFGSTQDGTIYQLNADSGELINTYPSEGASVRFYTVWDKLIVVREDKVELFATDGSKPENIIILKDYLSDQVRAGSSCMISEGSKENEIYFCNKSGVYCYTFGGNIVEQLVDGSLSSLSAVNVSYLALFQKKEGNFRILYNDYMNNKYSLLDYAYNKDIPSVPTDELRVYSIRENDTIQSMINAFQKDNPDIHVIYETGITGDNAISETDAVKTLNTEMIADKGPDILVLDHMPVDSYAEKGMLYDMSQLFASIEDENDLFTNIAEAYKQNGKLYSAPIRFKIPFIAGMKEILDKATDIETLALTAQSYRSSNPTDNFLQVDYEDVLFQKLFSVYYQNCFNGDGSINKEYLKTFLVDFKTVYDVSVKNRSEERAKEEQMMREVNEEMDPTIDFNDLYEDIFFNTYGFSNLDTVLSIGMLSSAKGFSDFVIMKENDPDYTGGILNTSTHFFKPVSPVGINSKSKNTENAKKFIKFLFSDTAQGIQSYNGFPVNKNIFLKGEDQPSEQEMSEINLGRSIPYQWASKEKFKELNDIVASLDTPSYINRSVIDIIYTDAEKYFTGDSSIDEVLDLIMQKLNLYLTE